MSASQAPEGGLPGPDQALAGALLPVLLHRIRNTTQLVTGVNAVLALEQGGPLPEARAGDLAQASREADELGWLLAVLSGGLGADLAAGRREPGGLRVTLELVRDALRRAAGALEFSHQPWPELSAAAPAANLCLCVAELVWQSGLGAEGAELGFERGEEGWQLWMRWERQGRPGSPPPDGAGKGANRGAGRLPEARLAVGEDRWVLHLPPAWLAPGTEPRAPA